MNKLLKGLLVLFISFIFMGSVNAASAKFSVSASSSQVIVGNNITVTVVVSSTANLGAWEYTLNYDKNYFKLVSKTADLHNAAYAANNKTKSVTYKYTFKALKSGSSKFYIDSSSAIDFDENNLGVSNGSKTVSIITYAEYQSSLSSNNYLKNLQVDGQSMKPEFKKDTEEYLVQVNEDTKSIKISATKEDSKSSVNGTGTFEVSPGNNVFEIIVVAQNGSERTYKITVEVLDKNPIKVNVDDKEYTVVKIASNLKKPNSYEDKQITINDTAIPAFYSDVTNFTLVGLKDEKGDISLFIYDDNEYKKYNEITFGTLTIYPLKTSKSVSNFKNSTVTIQGVEYNAYESIKDSRYYLIYGLNVETGEEGLFLYDHEDDSLIKYSEKLIGGLTFKNKILLGVICVFGLTTFGFFLIILSMLHKNKKLKKIIKEFKKVPGKKSKVVEDNEN